jgi:hypothetical protein
VIPGAAEEHVEHRRERLVRRSSTTRPRPVGTRLVVGKNAVLGRPGTGSSRPRGPTQDSVAVAAVHRVRLGANRSPRRRRPACCPSLCRQTVLLGCAQVRAERDDHNRRRRCEAFRAHLRCEFLVLSASKRHCRPARPRRARASTSTES